MPGGNGVITGDLVSEEAWRAGVATGRNGVIAWDLISKRLAGY